MKSTTKLLFRACLIVAFNWTASTPHPDNATLELIQVIFRHGQRTPQEDEKKLITNVNISLEKPYGFGQLTNEGKRQEYELGRMLRSRYNEFLGETYHPEDLYACSSDYDRTKASLQLVLAGLYPPTAQLRWNPRLNWQPIPAHYLPKYLDNLFLLTHCPKYGELYRQLMDSEEMKVLVKKYEDVLEFLSKHYPQFHITLEHAFYVNNLLTIQEDFGVPMPDWYTPEIHGRIKQAAKFYLDTLSYTPELIRLNGGGLTRRFVENLDHDDNDENEVDQRRKKKIYLYSGHEYTVYAVSKAHNVTLPVSPAFGSALVLEKWRDTQSQGFVKMYFWTGKSKEPIPIDLHGCGDYCPIEKYLKIVKPFLPSDDEMLCLQKNMDLSKLDLSTIQ